MTLPEPNHRTPTLRTIARRVGCGLVTVSYALRDHPRVRPELRQRIQEAARLAGYRPNPLVTALMTSVRGSRGQRTTGTIACLAWWREAAGELNPRANARFLAGARQRAERLGWRIDEIACDHQALSQSRLDQILASRGILGVLVAPLPSSVPALALDWTRLAGATWGYSLRHPLLHRAVVHHGRAVSLAFARARNAGCRRIGLAVPGRADARAAHFYTMALHAEQLGWPGGRPVRPFLPDDAGWNFAAFARWLRRGDVDALVTTQDVRPWLQRLPAAVRPRLVVSLDRGTTEHPGPGVDYRHEAVGAAAVDLIIEQLNTNERGLPSTPKTVLIEPAWTGSDPAAPS